MRNVTKDEVEEALEVLDAAEGMARSLRSTAEEGSLQDEEMALNVTAIARAKRFLDVYLMDVAEP